jgi:hypothetical protein
MEMKLFILTALLSVIAAFGRGRPTQASEANNS